MPVVDPPHPPTGDYAHRYAALLHAQVDGHALWTPSEKVSLGDCGVISDGRFEPIFNVYNPPKGTPGLPLYRPPQADPSPSPAEQPPFNPAAPRAVHYQDVTIQHAEQPPGHCFSSSVSLKVHYDANAEIDANSTLRLRATVRFTASRETSDLAFLVPRGRKRVVHRLAHLRVIDLEKYLAQHYYTIKRLHGVTSGEIVIVEGCVHACGWINGVSHSSRVQVGAELRADGPGIGGSIGISRDATTGDGNPGRWEGNAVQPETTAISVNEPGVPVLSDTNPLQAVTGGTAPEGNFLKDFPGQVQEGPDPHRWDADQFIHCVIIMPVCFRGNKLFLRLKSILSPPVEWAKQVLGARRSLTEADRTAAPRRQAGERVATASQLDSPRRLLAGA